MQAIKKAIEFQNRLSRLLELLERKNEIEQKNNKFKVRAPFSDEKIEVSLPQADIVKLDAAIVTQKQRVTVAWTDLEAEL